jgi:hypothetical protein
MCVQVCGDNIDCPPSQVCFDGEDHQYCADGERICDNDDDCSGWTCVMGKCEEPIPEAGCFADGDCDPGMICVDGECVMPECRYDGDCDAGYGCENGRCIPWV